MSITIGVYHDGLSYNVLITVVLSTVAARSFDHAWSRFSESELWNSNSLQKLCWKIGDKSGPKSWNKMLYADECGKKWLYLLPIFQLLDEITSDRKNSQLVSSGTKMTDLRILDAAAACN